jgi:filamentous hemagglutinin family protein
VLWAGVAAALLAVAPAAAGPEGEQVVAGDVQFDRQGDRTVIHAGDNSIIDYSGFDILSNETVQFVQPGASSRVLNRVLSAEPTVISGQLLANGQVYVANPAGIYFGDQAVVDVGGLYAAAADITNRDFLDNVDRFAGATGEVVNRGTLTGDAVHLVGRRVANYGTIRSDNGVVTMVAGGDVYLGEYFGDVLVRVDGLGEQGGTGVDNAGTVQAEGGRVRMAAGDVYSIAVCNTGSVRARDITVRGDGPVEVSGRLDASDASPGARGGTVRVSGETVAVRGAEIDASGAAGGGTVHVGGALRGGGELPTAARTLVTAEANLRADALTAGDGGEVVVWSDEMTGLFGWLSARGGPGGGSGGVVEVSGGGLIYAGAADLTAPAGEAGTLLLDPTSLSIVASGADDAELDDNEILAGDTPDTMTISASKVVTQLDTAAVSMAASSDITVSAAVDASGNTNAYDLTLAAPTIDLDAPITLADGASLLSDAGNAALNVSSSGLIQNAIDLAADSATVTVAAGTYDEQIVVEKPLTLDGSSQAAILQPSATPDSTFDVRLLADDVTLQNFTLDFNGAADDRGGLGITVGEEGGSNAFRIEVLDNLIYTGDRSIGGGTAVQTAGGGVDVSNMLVQGNEIHGDADGGGVGVIIFNRSGLELRVNNNTMRGNLHTGIRVENSYVTVTNNDINSDAVQGTYGIYLTDTTGGGDRTSVEIGEDGAGNTVTNFQDALRIGTGTETGPVFTATVEDNTLTGNDLGLHTLFGANVTVSGNTFSNNTTQVQKDGDYLNIPDVFDGNTFDNCVMVRDDVFQPLDTLWSTIQEGTDQAADNYGVYVKAGDYAESVDVDSGFLLNMEDGVSLDGLSVVEAGYAYCQGSLQIDGPTALEGAMGVEDDVTFNGTFTATGSGGITTGDDEGNVTFTGLVDADVPEARTLTIIAGTGTVDFQSAIGSSVPLGQLTVDSADQVNFNHVTLGDDGLDVTATTGISLGGDIATDGGTNAGALTFQGPVTVDAAVSIDTTHATGDDAGMTFAQSLTLNADLNLASGSGQIAFDDTADVGTHALTAGSGAVSVAGQVGGSTGTVDFTGAETTVTGAVALTDAGSVLLGQTALQGGTVETVGGTVTFDGPLTCSQAAGQIGTAGGIATFNDSVTLSTDLAVSSGAGDVAFNGALAGPGSLTVNAAGTTTFGAAVGGTTPLGSITTDADGQTVLAADLTCNGGSITLLDPVTLAADVTLRDTGSSGILLGNTVDSDAGMRYDLTLLADTTASGTGIPTIAFGDDVGSGVPLGDLNLNYNGTTVTGHSTVPAVASAVIRPVDANGQPISDPTFAHTITVDDAFRMGTHEKLTVLGDLVINVSGAGGTATLGDVNTLGDLTVTADNIVMLGRSSGFVLDSSGGLASDAGLDCVAGGSYSFSVTPTVTGGSCLFGSPTGIVGGNLGGFGAFATGTLDETSLVSGGTVLDLGYTSAASVETSVYTAEEPIPQTALPPQPPAPGMPTDQAEQALQLGFEVRPLTPQEQSAAAVGPVVYMDYPLKLQETVKPWERRVAAGRVSDEAAEGAYRLYREIFWRRTVGPRGEPTWVSRAPHLSAVLQRAVNDVLTGGPVAPAALADYLAGSDEHAEAHGIMVRLGRLLRRLRLLGLTEPEYGAARRAVLRDVAPAGMSLDAFADAVQAAAR